MDQALQFGKEITTQSWHQGLPVNKKVEYQIPEVVTDRNQALTEVMKGFTLIDSQTTSCVTLTIRGDGKGSYKMVTRQYEIDQET